MFLDRSPHKWLKLKCPLMLCGMKGIHWAMQEHGCTVIMYITVVFVFHYLILFFKSYFFKGLLNGSNNIKH